MEAYLSSPLSTFRPWAFEGDSPQQEFLQGAATHRNRVFRGGNRSGKTTIGGFDLALHLCGWHPFSKFEGPVHWWASAVSFRDGIGTVLWPALKQFLPAHMIRSVNWAWRTDPETPSMLTMRDGSTCVFKSVEQTRAKYQGAKLHGVWIDEEHPADIVEECEARLLDHAGYLNVTLTPVRRERWVRKIEEKEGTLCVQASTLDAAKAGVINLEATLAFAKSLPERQRRVRILGDHVALEGAVWPDFSRKTHVVEPEDGRLWLGDVDLYPWPLPPSWRRFCAIDFGFNNPTAVVLACEDPFTHRLIVERVYYSPQVRASEWAKHMEHRLPVLSAWPWADHDSFARAEFEAEGVPTLAAKKDVNAGLECVARYMEPNKDDGVPMLLVIEDDTLLDDYFGRVDGKVLTDEIEGYHYKPHVEDRPDPKDEPVKANDHACDGLRYLCMGHEQDQGGSPKPPQSLAPAVRKATALTLSWPDEEEGDTSSPLC